MLKILIKIIVLMLSVSPICAEEEVLKYVCIPDDAVGFLLKEDKWISGRLAIAESSRPIIQKHDGTQWRMYGYIGDKSPCSGVFDELGYFECHTDGAEFYFNRSSLRFQSYLRDGYVMGNDLYLRDKPELHPGLAIGTCTPVTKNGIND